MKKVLCLLLVLALSVFGLNTVNAQVVSMNFKESAEDEITVFGQFSEYKQYTDILKAEDFKDYEPSKDKVQVHIFRGRDCWHCLEAVTYFTSIYKEYGDKFDLVTYDVANSDNSSLMSKVGNELDADTNGVPLIVIAETAFEGYGSSMNNELLKLIQDNYKSDSYVDAVTEILHGTYKKDDTKEKANKVVSYIILGITAAIIVGIVVSRSNTSYYDEEALEDEEEVVEVKEEKPVAAKKETAKKTTAKKTTAKKTTAKKTTKKK